MILEVVEYLEDSNEGVTVTLNLDNDAKKYLIEKGFNSILYTALVDKEILSEAFDDNSEVKNYEFWEHHCHRENDRIATLKGKECNWCGMTEEVIRQNEDHQERVNKYMEWRADER